MIPVVSYTRSNLLAFGFCMKQNKVEEALKKSTKMLGSDKFGYLMKNNSSGGYGQTDNEDVEEVATDHTHGSCLKSEPHNR